MRFSTALAALAALTSFTAALPAEEVEADQVDVDQVEFDDVEGFTLYQEATNHTFYRNAVQDLVNTHMRYNGNVSESLLIAAAKASGSVKTFPENLDKSYLTPTYIGTPAKKFMMNIDTGSSDLWVFSSELPKNQQKGHSVYKPGASKSSKRLKGSTWNIRYGDGSTSGGIVFTDRVRLAGITAKGQAVEAARRISAQFRADKNADGIFGFGFSNINNIRPKSKKTWFANVGPRLKNNVLGVNLNSGRPGSYDVGFINKKHYKGKIHYSPITRANGFWQIRPTGYSVGNRNFGTDFRIAIADTGTSLAYVPSSAARNFYRAVRSSAFDRRNGLYLFFCDDNVPTFSITIGGSKRTIPSKFIRYQVAGKQGGRNVCIGGIQPTPQPPLSILGDVFLKSQYVVFDQGKNRLGFADKK